MSDLIPRAEALRIAQEVRDEQFGADESCHFGWYLCGQEMAKRLQDIPAIGTCATCAEWRERGGTDTAGLLEGRCCRTQHVELASHFCAAHRSKEAVK